MLRPLTFALFLAGCGSSEPAPAPIEPAPVEAEHPAPEMPHAEPGEGQAMPMYACPMHPKETSNEPGECSQCGMALVKIEEGNGSDDHGEAKPEGEHDGHGH